MLDVTFRLSNVFNICYSCGVDQEEFHDSNKIEILFTNNNPKIKN